MNSKPETFAWAKSVSALVICGWCYAGQVRVDDVTAEMHAAAEKRDMLIPWSIGVGGDGHDGGIGTNWCLL